MKLSVLMITYNHGQFIAQALDSALMQNVDFEYEIVVGEDCSTDNTRAILQDYARRFPDRLKLLLREKNLGPVANYYDAMRQCSGQYIALLEGDDFWTDSRKLQTQVDLLDRHREFVGCFHDSLVRTEDGSKPDYNYVLPEYKGVWLEPGQVQFEDLLRVNCIPTCACVFRRGLMDDLPESAYRLKMGDYVTHLLNSRHGNFKYIDRVMSVYRHHSQGIWSSQTAMWKARKTLDLFHEVPRFAPRRLRAASMKALSLAQWEYADKCHLAGERWLAFRNAIGSVCSCVFGTKPSAAQKLKIALSRLVRSSSAQAEFAENDRPTTDSAARLAPENLVTPRVSVVLPVYNGQNYLEQAFSSVLRQTFSDFELLVVDDGSDDQIPSIAAKWALRDSRVKVLRIPHSGIVEALNRGCSVARGEYIARMDADDQSLPDRLAEQVRFLDDHRALVAVGSAVRLIDRRGSTQGLHQVATDHASISTQLEQGSFWALIHAAAMFRKNSWARVGGYRLEFQFAEDVDLMLRLCEQGELANISRSLVAFRQHSGALRQAKSDISRRQVRCVLESFRLRREDMLRNQPVRACG